MTIAEFRADLHIHTCLSPCADDGMTPSAIVARAKELALDLIGICDHNSAANVAAVREAGRGQGLPVVGGMEITTQEEIHIMGFFEHEAALGDMERLVQARLPGKNDPDAFGFQIVVDAHGRPTALNDLLLIGATDLSLERVVDAIHERGGLVIASHVDRDAFSITSQLGFLPPQLSLDAIEVSAGCGRRDGAAWGRPDLQVVAFSDAHFPWDIGKAHTRLRLGAPSFPELAKALGRAEGRCVCA